MKDATLFFLGAIENSLNIQIEMGRETADDLLSLAPKYNNFTGQLAKDILQAADKILPKHQNVHAPSFEISIGREYSMVMYLKRSFLREAQITPDSDINMLLRYAKDHSLADEADYSIKGEGGFTTETFRFWWD